MSENYFFPLELTSTLLLLIASIMGAIVWIRLISHTEPSRPFQRSLLQESWEDLSDRQRREVTKESDYPDGWWTSEELLSTERRAIFEKMPIALAHANVFPTPGSYCTIDHPAGYSLVLVLDKNQVLRGFHNVCRHRAYPVISGKQSGCSLVLACKYHGWSYNLEGSLVKAPKFAEVDEFYKRDYSLFQVDVQVDTSGNVLVDVGSQPCTNTPVPVKSMKWEFVTSWETEGNFNWKVAESVDAFRLPIFTSKNGLVRFLESLKTRLGLKQGVTHTKPSILTDVFTMPQLRSRFMITVYPTAAGKCVLKSTFYTHLSASASVDILDMNKAEVSDSISSIEAVYSSIIGSNTGAETADQSCILGWVKSHRRHEKVAGGKIWPALVVRGESKNKFSTAETFCLQLEVDAMARKDGPGTKPASTLLW